MERRQTNDDLCTPQVVIDAVLRIDDKVADEADAGCEIAALVRGDHSTAWWRLLRERVRVICYWDGRVSFVGGALGSGNFASALMYFGARPYRAADAWASCGDVRVIR